MKPLLFLLAASFCSAQSLDLYGGRNDISCAGTNAHFFTQKIGAKWWLCTPLGHGFFFQGVSNLAWNNNATTGGYNYQGIITSKFASDPNGWQYGWADNTLARIKSWGFNAIGDSSNDYVFAWGAQGGARTPATKLPAIPANTMTLYSFENRDNLLSPGVVEKNLMDAIVGSAYTGFVGRGLPDAFDAGYASYVNARWTLTLADSYYKQWLTSPYSLGVVVDESDDIFGLNGPGLQPPNPPDGTYHPHAGWISIAVPPRRYASAATIAGANLNLTYNDPTIFAKLELIKELDKTTYPATGKYASIGALNTSWGSTYTTFQSSGTQYTAESVGTGNGSTKVFSGTLAHSGIDHFSVGLKVAGVVTGGDMGNGSVNPQTTFASSAVLGYNYGEFLVYFNTPPANGATLSLTYNYTACGSGTATTTWGTGDGVTQFYNSDNQPPITWQCGLGNPVGMTPGTLSIKVNGVSQGTDASTPAITGSGVSSSFVNYSTGAYSFTFITAPVSSAAITVDYHTNGWCNGGTGILDECGSHTAWLGATDGLLNPALASAGAVTDLNTFLYNFSYKYFNTHRAAFKAVSPTQLMFCPELNNHGGLTRSQTLQAAGQLCDVMQAGANTQALLDATEQYAGDVPLFQGFIGNAANPDSSLHAFANPGGDTLTTQSQRGAYVIGAVSGTVNGAVTSTGNVPNIGYTLWDWADAWCDGGSCAKVNWGLVTSRDNVYDGLEAVSALNITCQSPQSAYHTCGGEDFNYGNLLTSVKSANALWLASSSPCSVDSNGICVTGLSPIQNNLLGPLTPYGSNPWTYGDLANKGTVDYMVPIALAEAPVLGTALSGTFSFTSGSDTLTTTADLRTPLSGIPYIVVAWNSVDGAGTGRLICPISSVTINSVVCSEHEQEPSFSGVTGYIYPTTPDSHGCFPANCWTAENPSQVWNYYDVSIGLYRLYYRTLNSQYQTWARQFADIQWQWVLDHGYRAVSPRAGAMVSQFFRAGESHAERLPGLYNLVSILVPLWATNSDLRESGYTFWYEALGAKVDADPTRHAQYCAWQTTYSPHWTSTQNADGSWSENEFGLNPSYVSAPKSFTPPFQYQGAPWREAINIKSLEAAYESLSDTSAQGCNNPTLAATLLTSITAAVTWQNNYGRDSSNRGDYYEVNSQSNDQASVSPATGTVSATLTSTNITGVGTGWQTSGYCDGTHFIGFYTPRTVYKIASCADNTHATLSIAFGLYGEMSNVSGDQFGIAPAASSACHSSATYCYTGTGDRNLTRTNCGGIGWLYNKTLNTTYKGWGDECYSATLGGPTAGLNNLANLGSITLPCAGPACDGLVTDVVASAANCNDTSNVPPCLFGVSFGNLGKNYGEAFGAPGIDNELAWRLSGAGPIVTSSSPLPNGTNGISYSYQFTASGSTPITWTSSGLPGWASLSSGGLLTGTAATGVFSFTVTASNASGNSGAIPFSLTIVNPVPVPTCSPKTHVSPPTATDIQLQTNMALGTAACTNSLTGSGCTVVDVQRIINAALGGACIIGP